MNLGLNLLNGDNRSFPPGKKVSMIAHQKSETLMYCARVDWVSMNNKHFHYQTGPLHSQNIFITHLHGKVLHMAEVIQVILLIL